MRVDPPAVVVGAGINGLGVARSLRRGGVRAFLTDSDPTRSELRTRAARALCIPTLHGEEFVEALLRLHGRHWTGERPVLMLTQEEHVALVSKFRDRLSSFFLFSLPLPETVTALLNKACFQKLAEGAGAPIPPLVRVRSIPDLDKLSRLHYPVVVKPAERDAAYARRFRKAYRMETADETSALVREILTVFPDVVVQEWTGGPDSNIYFCLQYFDHAGGLVASFTGRKVRSWPPQVGGTASCVPAPEAHSELSQVTARFFRHVGMIGMAAMEYKRDARNGEYRMIEPTIGRTDYQAEVATLNGVNLPLVAWGVESGNPIPAPARVPHPMGWRVRSEDLQSARAQHQPARLDVRVADAVWRWNDPVPGIVQMGRRATRLVPSLGVGVRSRPQTVKGAS